MEQRVVGAIPGMVSVPMAALLPARWGVRAGFAYAVMPALMPLRVTTARRRRARARDVTFFG